MLNLAKIPFLGSPNFNTGRHGQSITYLVIHAMVGTMAGTLATFHRKGGDSAHYGVGRDGSVVQYVKDQDKAWHVKDANAFCLGVEHEDIFKQSDGSWNIKGCDDPKIVWTTPIQLDNSAQLVAQLLTKYNIPIKHMIGHNDPFLKQFRNDHVDPGVLFPWTEYRALVAKYIGELKTNA